MHIPPLCSHRIVPPFFLLLIPPYPLLPLRIPPLRPYTRLYHLGSPFSPHSNPFPLPFAFPVHYSRPPAPLLSLTAPFIPTSSTNLTYPSILPLSIRITFLSCSSIFLKLTIIMFPFFKYLYMPLPYYPIHTHFFVFPTFPFCLFLFLTFSFQLMQILTNYLSKCFIDYSSVSFSLTLHSCLPYLYDTCLQPSLAFSFSFHYLHISIVKNTNHTIFSANVHDFHDSSSISFPCHPILPPLSLAKLFFDHCTLPLSLYT